MKTFFARKNPAPLAFTLIEMLVVIAIIGILAAMLMPSLQKARRSALDTKCTNSMKQTLTLVAIYNNDWKQGLQNYRPDCNSWGKGWDNTTGAHGDASTPGGNYNNHKLQEGASQRTFWRSYLVGGGYTGSVKPDNAWFRVANADILGCSVKDYTGQTIRGAYSGGDLQDVGFPVSFPWERINEDSQKRAQAFIWYGGGVIKSYQVAAATGGNLCFSSPTGVSANSDTDWWKAYTGNGGYSRGRFPLLTCPAVYISQLNGNNFELPHRQEWGIKNVTGTTPVLYETGTFGASTQPWGAPFAGNNGFSDGSVRFRELNVGHVWNPKTWKIANLNGF